MTDVFTKEKRSEIMSKIQGRDTKIEVAVRKYLFRNGFRYRKNDIRYPGKPDILLPKYKAAVFVNGCFWHDHKECKYAYKPKSHTDFWVEKIKSNSERDKSNKIALTEMGFKVIVIWECELRNNKQKTLDRLVLEIKNCDKQNSVSELEDN